MRLHYWPDNTPEGGDQAMPIKPFHSSPSGIWNPADIPAWLTANSWEKDVPGAIVISFDDWQEVSTKELLKDSGSGLVTEASIAAHIQGGLSGWSRVWDWFLPYLEAFVEAGYKVGFIFMDIEGGKCGSHDDYDAHPTDSVVLMQDVVEAMVADPAQAARLPILDYTALYDGTFYSPDDTRQAAFAYSHWMTVQNCNAWTKYILRPAQAIFGSGLICNAYGHSQYTNGNLLDWNSGWARPSASVGGHSSPVLYMDGGYQFLNTTDQVNAYHLCKKTPSCIPWIAGPWQTGGTWIHTEDDYDDIVAQFTALGLPHLCVF